MSNKVLLINDYVSSHQVALKLQSAYFEKTAFEVFSLPTVLFSNTFNFGQPASLDTTEYVESSLGQYQKLNWVFEGVLIGYIHHEHQVAIINELITNNEDMLVIVDPIMGDRHQFYQSLDYRIINYYHQVIPHCAIITPNLTEAQLLINDPLRALNDLSEVEELLYKLQKLNNKSVVITSVEINQENFVIGYDHLLDKTFKFNFEKQSGQFYGTGDLFSAVLFEQVLNGFTLEAAAHKAHDLVRSNLSFSIIRL